MTTQQFKQLEELLGELNKFLNSDFCIIPNMVQDGYHIALYNEKGEPFIKEIDATLEGAALKCKLSKLKQLEESKVK